MKKVELLSPAGNYEAFLGAIHAGADAVYLGGEKYGARAYADNFTEEEIIMAIRYAHIFGRKVYLTINTLMKEQEYEEICSYLTPFYEHGLDGVIIQDIGGFMRIKQTFPKLELHASTQMTLTGSKGISYLKYLGASRVVPARELSLDEIRSIKEKVNIELECFVHGAMCYCYSGQCLFSSILGGRSGNRGRCAQPCRLPYKIKKDGKESYPFSLKDMCTITFLPKLIETGIDSFKIEGRMKKPEYTAGVTAIYRKYIDMFYEKGAKAYCVSQEDLNILSKLYIRSEIQDGYYFRHNGKEMITPGKPSYSGSDELLCSEIRKKYIEKKCNLPITMYGSFYIGKESCLTISYKEIEVTATGDIVEKAQNRPMNKEDIEKQLKKVGNTTFECNQLSINMDDNIFIPNKSLNELRRMALKMLENAIIEKNGFDVLRNDQHITKPLNNTEKNLKNSNPDFSVVISTKEQLTALYHSEYTMRRVYLDYQLIMSMTQEEIRECETKWNLGAVYPRIVREKSSAILNKIYEKTKEFPYVISNNMETFAFLRDKSYAGEIIWNYTMYVFNSGTAHFAARNGNGFCYPLELNKYELSQIKVPDNIWKEQLVYSYIPLMVTANCLKKTTDQCGSTKKIDKIYDRYQKCFYSKSNCMLCYSEIYNCVPLSLHKYYKDMNHQIDAYRIDFTIEDFHETKKILDMYLGKPEQIEIQEYTTGHYKRGVE